MRQIFLTSVTIVFGVWTFTPAAKAQGTFIYDQQSADENTVGGAGGSIQGNQPIGQSFTPSLNAIGFIRLNLYDGTPDNGIGATVYVNLRADSITGTILGSTAPVFMADRFGRGLPGYPDFLFQSAIPVTPGVTYFFQPVVESGDTWGIAGYSYNYSGGTAFFNGIANTTGTDLWFREGIMVPEPSTWTLILIGAGFVFTARLFNKRRSKAGNEIK